MTVPKLLKAFTHWRWIYDTKLKNDQMQIVWIKILHTSRITNLQEKQTKTNLRKSFDRTLQRGENGLMKGVMILSS